MSNMTKETTTSSDTPKQPESLKQEALYTALVNVRNTELTVYWTRYNIQSAINFVLLAAALAGKSDSLIGKNMKFAVCAGILLALFWIIFVVKGKELLTDRWEKHIRTYEESTPQGTYRLFCEIKKEEDSKGSIQRKWDNLDYLSRALPILCMVAWIILGIWLA